MRGAVLALVLVIPSASVSALSCGKDPMLEMYGFLAEQRGVPTHTIEAAASMTALHLIRSADVIFEGEYVGAECVDARTARITYDNVVWLKGNKAGQSERRVDGVWHFWSEECKPDTPKARVRTLMSAARPDDADMRHEALKGVQFRGALCMTHLSSLLDSLQPKAGQRWAPHLVANNAALKKAIEGQLDQMRPQDESWRDKYRVFQRR